MSCFSCKVEISNSSSSVLVDPEMYLFSGQCSVPLSPLLRLCTDGGATFTSTEGNNLVGLFGYNLPDVDAMLAVLFLVPSPGNGSNDFAVAIIDPIKCDHNLHKQMTEGSEHGPLCTTKARACWNSLVVRATMSATANAVLKVDVSNIPL